MELQTPKILQFLSWTERQLDRIRGQHRFILHLHQHNGKEEANDRFLGPEAQALNNLIFDVELGRSLLVCGRFAFTAFALAIRSGFDTEDAGA